MKDVLIIAERTFPEYEGDALAILINCHADNVRLQFERIRNDVQHILNTDSSDDDARSSEEDSARRMNPQSARSRKGYRLLCTLAADVHFLLISLQQFDQILETLIKAHNQPQELTGLRERHGKWLKDCNDFRNHLEHMDERIIKDGIRDFGRVSNNFFVYNGQSFSYDEGQERRTEEFVQDFLETWSELRRRLDGGAVLEGTQANREDLLKKGV